MGVWATPIMVTTVNTHQPYGAHVTLPQQPDAKISNVAMGSFRQVPQPDLRIVALPQASAVPAPAVVGSGQIAALTGRRPSCRPLPEGSEVWTRFEKDLFVLSGAAYNPAKMAQRRRIQCPLGAFGGTGAHVEAVGRVSIVTPTMSSRQRYHEQLWDCFVAQTWPDKELIVIESYEDQPSAYFRQKAKEDPRLVHVCFKRGPKEDFSVGLKRDMTLHLASGEFIVNFDDDDIYAPTYVSKMVGEMRQRGLVAITLSTWYNYFVSTDEIGYTDPQVAWEEPPENMDPCEMEEVLYGYGFSYVHTRRASLALPYPDVEFAEDAPFFIRMKQVFGASRVALKQDQEGLCMHLVHRANSAGDMPIARSIALKDVSSLDVGTMFERYLENREVMRPFRHVMDRIDLAVQSFSGLWRQIPAAQAGACELKHRRVKSC
mmetsp:Transcript_60702/g.169690  ORF Transcript_60702/g.169690 Transcript_60702/m.169690 type:complete len:431 (-) Transcript_60702:93-1385(-)